MNCEICGSDPERLVSLPIKKLTGEFNTIACVECSQASGLYCVKHERPHLGFEDDTSVCTECIEGELRLNGERVAGFLAAEISKSPLGDKIKEELDLWWSALQDQARKTPLDIPLTSRVLATPRSLNLARLVVIKAQRSKVTPEEVIRAVATEGTRVILP